MPAAQVGDTAVASWVPPTAYYTLDNSLTTSAPGDPVKPGVERWPGSMTVRLFGRTPLGQQGFHTALAIEDPADYAARSLKEMLVARGVQGERDSPGPTSLALRYRRLLRAAGAACHAPYRYPAQPAGRKSGPDSARLACLAATGRRSRRNQQSQPEPARRDYSPYPGQAGEHRWIPGRRHAGGAPVPHLGRRRPQRTLSSTTDAGFPCKTWLLPRAFTTLLVYAARQSWGEAFRTSLPVGGVDGSLSAASSNPCSTASFSPKRARWGKRAL